MKTSNFYGRTLRSELASSETQFINSLAGTCPTSSLIN